jgi:AbrB family looped-hinge helix DNA binding protein
MRATAESTLTSKGQVTVPAAVRRALRLHAGDRLHWRVEQGGEVTVERVLALDATALATLLPPARASFTTDELDDASARAYAEELGALGR